MSTPAGVTRRDCSLGTFPSMVSGKDFGAIISVRASVTGPVWAATGEAVFSATLQDIVTPGDEAIIPLIPTDLEGWLIGAVPVDVSHEKPSHVYTITVQATRVVSGTVTQNEGWPVTYPNVAIPSAAGTLDLDCRSHSPARRVCR